MEYSTSTENEVVQCPSCKQNVSPNDAFCQNCGYPLKGTDEDIRAFKAKKIIEENNQEELRRQVKNARTSLIVVAVLTIIGGLLEAVRGEKEDAGLIVIISVILAAIYGALAAWSTKKPFAALLSGLIVFISIILISGFLEPITFIKGIVVKILVIVYLTKGVIGASKVKNMEDGEE